MKKVVRLIVPFLLSVTLLSSGVAFAADLGSVNAAPIDAEPMLPEDTFYNEGSAYIASKAMTDQELLDAGLTEIQLEELRAFSMEDALLERAQLPTDILHAYGYTDEQIVLLREYDGSPLTENSSVLAATSDCVGTYDIGNYSTSSISFTYTWTWSIVPLVKMEDTVVVAWQGVRKPDNLYFDLTPSTNIMYLHFYNMTSGARASSQDISVQGVHSSTEDYTSFRFDMTTKDNYYWAKEGVVYLTLYPDSSSSPINYIDLGAGYGHQTLEGSYTFSVSPSLEVSFSSDFPIQVIVVQEDNASGRVYSNGRCQNYGSTI